MLDIIFISYDEPNADRNFNILKKRFPHAKRVHDVKGIANAHIAAAKKSITRFFYVVDGDALVLDTFDFSYKPMGDEEKYVHIWKAYVPIGLVYGYGGVKLFSKAFFKDVKTQLDFSTTLTKDVKYHEAVSCITEFNSDPFRAFRGAFREGAKLERQRMLHEQESQEYAEASIRLTVWTHADRSFNNKGKHHAYGAFIRAGVEAGMKQAQEQEDLLFINDHDLTIAKLKEAFPNVDLIIDPTPPADDPMRDEFFFTTRIASILYDEVVLKTLPITELRDAISDGQLLSKRWLVEEFKKVPDLPEGLSVLVLGGWIGTLPLLMHASGIKATFTSVDLDDRVNRIAEKLNYDHDFKTMNVDMYNVDYANYDVIINTSSEHIPDIEKWAKKIPKNRIVIVQNNNFLEGAGHVSCVANSDELRQVLGLRKVAYEGTRQFSAYSRYMIIGMK
jgi:galactitol-specific phosphotransferase system IIB component